MTISDPAHYDALIDARERYRVEREKRLRKEGLGQYRELKGDYAEFDRDPYVEPGFERDPVVEETEVVIVGGGFAGMLTAVNLIKNGVTDFLIVDKAGDFGGTWYWNRYPGCMCDVESCTYLPLLEETGYMPAEKYASAPEIFAYCQLIGRQFELYPHALFQTEISTATWDERSLRWKVTTSRGDQLSARFFVTAGGILHKAKLPGIPGIEDFKGRTFHTSRWDYSYTGGSSREPMENLRGKRVGIVGHGRHGGSGGAPSGRDRQGALRVPAHAFGCRGTRQRSDRRRVVQEPEARLAGRTDTQLHQVRHRREARRGPGLGWLDRGDVGGHPDRYG